MTALPSGIHVEQIKAQLRQTHGPITWLSVSWGYHRSGITNALRDPAYSTGIERRIATALALPLHEIWPTRWSCDGSPLPRSARQDPGPIPRPQTSKKRKAA